MLLAEWSQSKDPDQGAGGGGRFWHRVVVLDGQGWIKDECGGLDFGYASMTTIWVTNFAYRVTVLFRDDLGGRKARWNSWSAISSLMKIHPHGNGRWYDDSAGCHRVVAHEKKKCMALAKAGGIHSALHRVRVASMMDSWSSRKYRLHASPASPRTLRHPSPLKSQSSGSPNLIPGRLLTASVRYSRSVSIQRVNGATLACPGSF